MFNKELVTMLSDRIEYLEGIILEMYTNLNVLTEAYEFEKENETIDRMYIAAEEVLYDLN